MLDELIEFINNIGYDQGKVSVNSPELLRLVIEHKKFNLCNLFTPQAFNIDNVLLLIKNSNYENDVAIIRNISFNSQDRITVIKSLIEKGYYKLVGYYNYEIDKSEELLDLYLSNIFQYNIGVGELRFFMPKHSNKIITSLCQNKRFDLVSLLLQYQYQYNEDTINTLITNSSSIAKYIKLLNIDIPIKNFNTIPNLFKSLFLNGCSNIISCIEYYGSEAIIKLINESEEMQEKVISYIPTADVKYLKTVVSRLDFVKESTLALNYCLQSGMTSIIGNFKSTAWDLDNSLLCINLIRENKLPRKVINNNLLTTYYFNYDQIIYANYTSDPLNLNNIKNLNNSKKIHSLIHNNTITVTPTIKNLYDFIVTNNSDNICHLVYALLNGDVNNINLLFNENGITDFFKEYLKYDHDYILNNYQSLVNDDNPNYLTYVKLICSYPNLNTNYLLVNKTNVDSIFNNNTLTRPTIDLLFTPNGINILYALLDGSFKLELTEIEQNLIRLVNNIPTPKQKADFIEYYQNHKSEITVENLNSLYSVFSRINESNSYELRKQADNVISKILVKENPMEEFNKLEYALTSGAIPEFFKRFVIYKILYADIDIKDDPNVTSPILKAAETRKEADKIVFGDLLRISVASNSQDILDYMDIINKGNKLFNDVITKKITNLTENDLELLRDYRIKVEYIADYLAHLTYVKTDNDIETIYNIEEAYSKSKNLQYYPGVSVGGITDGVFNEYNKIFSNNILLTSYAYKHSIIRKFQEEQRREAGQSIVIQSGDFIKGIDSEYLDNILDFGMLAKEFLGEDSQRDATHLDSDMSLIEKNYSTIPELLASGLTGCTCGDMSLIISHFYMEQFGDTVITKKENNLKEIKSDDYKKQEIFSYNGDHWCARTGMPNCYIKGIIASKNFNRARFLVSRCNNYIPIYDRKGNLIYTYEEYEIDRAKKAGLSKYDSPQYNLSPNLINKDIINTMSTLRDDFIETEQKRNAILSKLSPIFNEYFERTTTHLTKSVLDGTLEIYDTGSTGRNTNVPDDGDYDFIMRIDRSFMNSEKYHEFITKIYNALGCPVGDEKIIRAKQVHLDGIDIPLDIDITVIDKNSKVDYTTDLCIKDRLNVIKQNFPDSYDAVKANIIFAKKFFKEAGIYKTFDKGFGGVGVENFILQHGGSFTDAINDFLAYANSCSNLDEFKRCFHIYDYGKNYYAFTEDNYKKVSFPYDDYVSFLSEKSYNQMIQLFSEYLEQQKLSIKAI